MAPAKNENIERSIPNKEMPIKRAKIIRMVFMNFARINLADNASCFCFSKHLSKYFVKEIAMETKTLVTKIAFKTPSKLNELDPKLMEILLRQETTGCMSPVTCKRNKLQIKKDTKILITEFFSKVFIIKATRATIEI